MLSAINGMNNPLSSRKIVLQKTLNVSRLQCVDDRHEYHLDILQNRYGWSRDEAQAELDRRLSGYLHFRVRSSRSASVEVQQLKCTR